MFNRQDIFLDFKSSDGRTLIPSLFWRQGQSLVILKRRWRLSPSGAQKGIPPGLSYGITSFLKPSTFYHACQYQTPTAHYDELCSSLVINGHRGKIVVQVSWCYNLK
jgi:hypothetical protein